MTNTNAPVTIRPEELATELGVNGKLVRGFLRRTFPRPIEAKGSTWVLGEEQANATREHFAKKNPDANAPATTDGDAT